MLFLKKENKYAPGTTSVAMTQSRGYPSTIAFRMACPTANGEHAQSASDLGVLTAAADFEINGVLSRSPKFEQPPIGWNANQPKAEHTNEERWTESRGDEARTQ